VTILGDMDVVNTSPALRTRPVKTQDRPSGKTEASIRKAEASEQRRRNERTVLEFVSQRFKLPAGKKHFSKTEVLSLGECFCFIQHCPQPTLRTQRSRTSLLKLVPEKPAPPET